jgi:hypothetical protein
MRGNMDFEQNKILKTKVPSIQMLSVIKLGIFRHYKTIPFEYRTLFPLIQEDILSSE